MFNQARETVMDGHDFPKTFAATPDEVRAADGTRLFVRAWGEGAPVLFLHSWSANSDMWRYQMIALAERCARCIAYDRRGHGRSSDPGGGYDFDTLADDLAAVIEALDLKDLTLVGHSMGAGEIVRYLSRHGADRVARIVLVSPTTPYLRQADDNPHGVDPAVSEAMRDAWRADFHQWLADNAAPFFASETSPATVRWMLHMAEAASLQAVIACNRAVIETDFREELARLRLPALVIHGDADVSAPLDFTGRRTAELIPGARLSVYAGAPHGLFVTHMGRLNAELAAFIGLKAA
jgi:pimeloyl-ACP methyl ester carboxylesterase